jgi:hypothetical protein
MWAMGYTRGGLVTARYTAARATTLPTFNMHAWVTIAVVAGMRCALPSS